MRIQLESGDVAIVLVGAFNPVIFRPDWFLKYDLLTELETDSTEVEVIHSEISIFSAPWFKLVVEPKRLTAIVTEEPHVRMIDMLVRTFKEQLSHTPILQLGINRRVHFKVKDMETLDKVGKKLAPQEPWGEWAKDISKKKKSGHGGMSSLTMQQSVVDDDRPAGKIRARVEPSVKVRPGIHMEVNDHYELEEKNIEKVTGCNEMIKLLENNFDKSLQRSHWIIDQIMALT